MEKISYDELDAAQHSQHWAKLRKEEYEKKIEFAKLLPENTNEEKYWKIKIIDDITDRYNERKWGTRAF